MTLTELLDALDEYDARKAARMSKAPVATSDQLEEVVTKGVAKALDRGRAGSPVLKAKASAPLVDIHPADGQMLEVLAMLNRRRAAGQ